MGMFNFGNIGQVASAPQSTPGKYPTFQDKYGQLAPQDQTYEQSKAPTDQQPAAPQPQENPWKSLYSMGQDEKLPEIQLAPQQWSYSGK
jgi:hypothetical protein